MNIHEAAKKYIPSMIGESTYMMGRPAGRPDQSTDSVDGVGHPWQGPFSSHEHVPFQENTYVAVSVVVSFEML